MIHPRQTIRDAVKALLLAGNVTDVGDRVSANRVKPAWPDKLPAIRIFTLGKETSEVYETAPKSLKRTFPLDLEIGVSGGDNITDVLDSLAAEVEKLMHADDSFTDTASDSFLSETDTGVDAENKRQVAFIKLTYMVRYKTYAPEAIDDDPELHDLKKVTAITTDDEGGVIESDVTLQE